MAESPSRRAAGRRPSSSEGRGDPADSAASPSFKLLGVAGREWSAYRSVSASPFVEHLALTALDLCVSICNFTVLYLLRPSWFQEVSDATGREEEAPEDGPLRPSPSLLYVSLLAIIGGVGGLCSKAAAVLWSVDSSACVRLPLLPALTVGGYCMRLRVAGSLYLSWLCVVGALLQLLGAPLGALSSSFLLAVFLATVGVAGPFASSVAEACRSIRWQPAEKQRKKGTSDHVLVRAAGRTLDFFLRCLDLLCLPVVAVCLKLRRHPPSCLRPQELGNLLLFVSVFPLVVCCFFSLVSCILLPMDWPTVYVVYPSPLVLSLTISWPLGCLVSFFILLLLPVFCSFTSAYARAAPVLQELMLEAANADRHEGAD